MSELKAHLFVPYSELQEGDELTDAFTIAKSYYLKSEADKVIDDKDKEIAELSELLTETREWLIESQKMHKRCADGAIKKIRHQKFKRCLAMASLCRVIVDWDMEIYGGTGNEIRAIFCSKWVKRWLELAEKFKEAK